MGLKGVSEKTLSAVTLNCPGGSQVRSALMRNSFLRVDPSVFPFYTESIHVLRASEIPLSGQNYVYPSLRNYHRVSRLLSFIRSPMTVADEVKI